MSDKTLSDLKYDAHVAVLHTKVDALIEKQKELTARVRANEKVVAAVTLLGTVVLAVIGAGYFAPKAEACSPPLDGSEFICPSHDGVVDRPTPVAVLDEPNIDYSNGQREEFRWNAGSVIQRMRDWKSEQERTPVEESINNALANLEINYGSNDPTESEELLLFQSSNDRQGT